MSKFAEQFETYNPKDKKQRGQNLTSVEQIQELATKPTSLIIMILLCVILGMRFSLGRFKVRLHQ